MISNKITDNITFPVSYSSYNGYIYDAQNRVILDVSICMTHMEEDLYNDDKMEEAEFRCNTIGYWLADKMNGESEQSPYRAYNSYNPFYSYCVPHYRDYLGGYKMNDDKYDLLVKRIEQLEKELEKEREISNHLAVCIEQNKKDMQRVIMSYYSGSFK